MRRTPLVIAAMTSALALTSAPALASDYYHHDRNYLEPGCFMPDAYGHYGHWGDVDLDAHLDWTALKDGDLVKELHVSVDRDAPFSIDQVLVKGARDGYRIYNVFDTGTVNNDEDIDPGQTAVDLFAPDGKYLDIRGTIVCVSDHDDADDNEPYDQEGPGKPIFAKNRPIIAPKVTAFGVSAIENLNTYRIGFGYSVERWYTGHRASTPAVAIFPRADSTVFDARGVNDVDKAGESWSSLFSVSDESDASGGQTFLFNKSGDMTAWADTSLAGYTLDNEGRYLYTNLTQGDLPMSWTLRAPLASPSSKRSVSFTMADYLAWNKAWQATLCDGAPMPSLPLAPGTNSPKADCPDPVIVSVTLPAPTPANPTPTPIVVNPTPVTVNTPGTIGSGIGANALADALAEAGDDCTSRRVIKFTWVKGSTNTKLRYRGRTVKGKMSNGRFRATADFRGYKASRGDLLKVAVLSRRGGRAIHVQRVFKAC